MDNEKNETTLYRKHRPQTFDDVIGQDHVVKTLKKAILDKTFAHAYIFAGGRGTGKTSIARIFAKEIGTTGNDLYEIDAASNRGIDDIRELRESVLTLPFESQYKIYIIDEVHMLTKDAFNALLKTLEEPPAHVIFILATTELEKVIPTIVSRCQSFTFKKPSPSVLKDVAIEIAKKEGYILEPSAAELVGILGDGSFRDTLGMVQKVISTSSDKKISAEEVELITGAPRKAVIDSLLSALSTSDLNAALEAISKAAEGNINMKLFLTLLIARIRYILLLRLAPGMEQEIKNELDDDDYVFLKNMSDPQFAVFSAASLQVFLSAYRDINYAHMPHVALELAVMRIIETPE
jgi:DNA polymerase-3 subunit gamma/tau